mgnify:CR=1 FL=1
MEGFLITILMFSVPIVAAIIDKKLKAGRKAQPLVHAEPIIFEDEEEEEPQRAITRTAAEDPWKAEEQPIPEVTPAQVQDAPAEPPVTAPHPEHISKPVHKRIKEKRTENYPTAEEIRKDRRKLILYKEIMTPKFDSE